MWFLAGSSTFVGSSSRFLLFGFRGLCSSWLRFSIRGPLLAIPPFFVLIYIVPQASQCEIRLGALGGGCLQDSSAYIVSDCPCSQTPAGDIAAQVNKLLLCHSWNALVWLLLRGQIEFLPQHLLVHFRIDVVGEKLAKTTALRKHPSMSIFAHTTQNAVGRTIVLPNQFCLESPVPRVFFVEQRQFSNKIA